jgi:hypothetical protein
MAKLAIEWAPPQFPSFIFFEFALPAAIVLTALVHEAFTRRRFDPVLLSATLATGVAAALKSGSIVWFAMAAMVLAADLAPVAPAPARATRSRATILMAGSSLIFAVLAIVTLASRRQAAYEWLPERVVTATATYATVHPCAQIIADNLTASGMLWHYPALERRIAYDARLEQYAPADLSRWLRFLQARGAGWTATTTGFDVLIASSSYAAALDHRLRSIPGGRTLASTSTGIAVLNTGAATDCRSQRGSSAQ